MSKTKRQPTSQPAIRTATALYSYIDEQAQLLLFGGTRASTIEGIARIIDDSAGLPDLLAACVAAEWWIRHFGGDDQPTDLMGELRAAIVKATAATAL